MDRNDFDSYSDLNAYWVREDALRSLDYDINFSLGKRYYCDAGCQVCYIKNNLAKTKSLPNYGNDIRKYESIWMDFLPMFGSIRTNDDLYYLKQFYKNDYEWYISHGEMFELCVTDNSLIRTLQLKDLKTKGIADVSISSTFAKQIGVFKLLEYVQRAHDRFGIKKLKYIDCGDIEILDPIIEWGYNNKLYNCVHGDFREERKILNHPWAEYQNTWIETTNDKVIRVNKEALHLYYNNFFYASDDACDLNIDPFYTFDDRFDIHEFLYRVVKGKQELYADWVNHSNISKFKEYFAKSLNTSVNRDFNFIPSIMYPKECSFFNSLERYGWNKTPYGLHNGQTPIISILSK